MGQQALSQPIRVSQLSGVASSGVGVPDSNTLIGLTRKEVMPETHKSIYGPVRDGGLTTRQYTTFKKGRLTMAQGNDENGLPVYPALHAQQHLARLVKAWREVGGDPLVRARYVKMYHETMQRMVEQGWNPSADQLGTSARLPDAEMPRAYRQRQLCEQHDGRSHRASADTASVLFAKHPVDEQGVPLDPELASLERALSALAKEWRYAVALPARRRTIVATYHAVMERMFELGWSGLLDAYVELPDHLMLPEYGRRLGRTGRSERRLDLEDVYVIKGVNVTNERLLIDITFDRGGSIPLSRIPELYAATEEQRAKRRLSDDGQAVEWPELGVTIDMNIFSS